MSAADLIIMAVRQHLGFVEGVLRSERIRLKVMREVDKKTGKRTFERFSYCFDSRREKKIKNDHLKETLNRCLELKRERREWGAALDLALALIPTGSSAS
jgi:hypothetical protein